MIASHQLETDGLSFHLLHWLRARLVSSRPCSFLLLPCRDTVCSVGVIPRTLPFIAHNTAIRTFRHALSLDERRVKFKADYFHGDGDDCTEADEKTNVKEVWFAGCHCGAYFFESFVTRTRRASFVRLTH